MSMRMQHPIIRSAATWLATFLVASVPLACVESTRPAPAPAIHLELADGADTIRSTAIRVRGVAVASRVLDIAIQDRTSEGGTWIWSWSGSMTDSARVVIDTIVELQAVPGRHSIVATMNYRNDDGSFGADSTVLTFDVYRRASFDFAEDMPDTVYGRSFSVGAAVEPALSHWALELVMDAGTPEETVLSGPVAPWDLVRPTERPDGGTDLAFDFPQPLPNGPRRAMLRLTDELGVRTIERTFVIHVPERRYALRALPGLSGGDAGASYVNDAGDAVGYAVDTEGRSRPMLWRQGGETVMLPLPGPDWSGAATAINASGKIVGSLRQLDMTCDRVAVWEGDSVSFIEPRPGWCVSAVDVSDAGVVLMRAYSPDFPNDSAAFTADEGLIEAVPGIHEPRAINLQGHVVGSYESSYYHLPLPASSVAVPEAPVRRGAGHLSGVLAAVNDASEALGVVGTTGLWTVYLTAPGRAAVDLTAPLGGPREPARPVWLTNDGTVLAGDATNGYFLWTAGRTSRLALEASGWAIGTLARMNEAGWVAGQGIEQATGAKRAVILEPIE